MQKKKNKKNNPSFIYKCLVKFVKIFYKKRTFVGRENFSEGPCVVVGNHAQMHGPLTSEIYYPRKKRIWCAGEMMELKKVPSYAYKSFWSYKPKCIKWFYKILSYLIAPISVYIFNRADTIPVYKNTRTLSTIKNSIKELHNGSDVIIFPEIEEGYNNILNKFNTGFVDVAKLYYSKYKKEISFVPMYNAPMLKTVIFGKPIKYDKKMPIEEQRIKIANFLQEEITKIAKSLPKHKVVPYVNVSKKKYPYNK